MNRGLTVGAKTYFETVDVLLQSVGQASWLDTNFKRFLV
jgi:hypothetical protein